MICLSHDEIIALTKKKRYVSQICALVRMHIPFRVRPDGSPLVLRSDLVQIPAIESSEVQLFLELPSA